jgi:AraC-like DNA-binding protein
MSYREYVPSQPLRQYVDCYWHYITGKPVSGNELPVQRCLPLGTSEIIIQVNGIMCDIFHNTKHVWEKSQKIYFTGLFTDTAIWRAQPNTFMFGIRLKPESLLELFNILPARLMNDVVDAEAILGATARRMCDEMTGVQDGGLLMRIAERYLLQRLGSRKSERNYLADACRLIRHTNASLSVEAVSDSVNVSRRQLERCFKEDFGPSPKTYQRIIRFRNAYRYARSKKDGQLNWADVSYESGYADQAHFIRDFKAFSGTAPSSILIEKQSFFQTLEVVH